MATPTPELIQALRTTIHKLESGARYQWTHQGSCNCGLLAQAVTQQDARTIHQQALQKYGDWADKVVDHCPYSGYPIDHVIDRMLQIGLHPTDISHLERLSDPQIRQQLPPYQRDLDYKNREHVVRYLRAWAQLLEDQWAAAYPQTELERVLAEVAPQPEGLQA